MEFLSSINENDVLKKAQLHQFFGEHTEFPTLMDTVKTLKSAERVSREYRRNNTSTSVPAAIGHNRSHSTSILPDVGSNAFLSIEDPIEEGGNNGGWYFDGRRSPSPPTLSVLQSAGETSPSQQGGNHRRALSLGGAACVPPLPTLLLATPSSPMKHSRSNTYCPTRSAKDSTLFRLIVALQLCLIRIEEANSVLCKAKPGLRLGALVGLDQDRFLSRLLI